MTTIYLHIGMPKTGTSSIQKFLFNNQENLLKKGYLYPRSGIISTAHNTIGFPQHLGLFKALLKKYDPKSPMVKDSKGGWETSWEDLKIEIKTIKPQNVIISSEFFTGLRESYNSDVIALAKKILEEYETKIILYMRRQDDFFRSSYCQYIKSPLPNKFPDFVKDISYKKIRNIKDFIEQIKYQADYYSIIDLWKNSFGVKNIILRPFEKEQIKNGNVVDDFLETVNLKYTKSDFKFNFSNYQNISHSGKVIKLIDLIESVSQIRRLPEGKYWYLYTRFAFFRMDSRIELATLLSRFIPDFLVSEELLSEEDIEIIMKEFEESNQKVAKEYLGREDGKLFYAKS